jgi:hypothetical protein
MACCIYRGTIYSVSSTLFGGFKAGHNKYIRHVFCDLGLEAGR